MEFQVDLHYQLQTDMTLKGKLLRNIMPEWSVTKGREIIRTTIDQHIYISPQNVSIKSGRKVMRTRELITRVSNAVDRLGRLGDGNIQTY